MHMWRIKAGLITNYLADVTFPPWYYMVIRSRTTTGMKTPSALRRFSATPLRAAFSIFIAGVAYEFAQRFGLIEGTYDTWDIIVYAVVLSICLTLERLQSESKLA